eukprot:GABV01008839.1.p1 GENE.GABV01008839.1~~GABV01008839.1.p1  ORF type:complete len:220 (-),score=63.88 GABV01008839.1:97-756(-)
MKGAKTARRPFFGCFFMFFCVSCQKSEMKSPPNSTLCCFFDLGSVWPLRLGFGAADFSENSLFCFANLSFFVMWANNSASLCHWCFFCSLKSFVVPGTFEIVWLFGCLVQIESCACAPSKARGAGQRTLYPLQILFCFVSFFLFLYYLIGDLPLPLPLHLLSFFVLFVCDIIFRGCQTNFSSNLTKFVVLKRQKQTKLRVKFMFQNTTAKDGSEKRLNF